MVSYIPSMEGYLLPAFCLFFQLDIFLSKGTHSTEDESRLQWLLLTTNTAYQKSELASFGSVGWIGHVRVPRSLAFKTRLSAIPFLWKWVLFAWELRKIIFKSIASHLASHWNRGLAQLGDGLSSSQKRVCLVLKPLWGEKIPEPQHNVLIQWN